MFSRRRTARNAGTPPIDGPRPSAPRLSLYPRRFARTAERRRSSHLQSKKTGSSLHPPPAVSGVGAANAQAPLLVAPILDPCPFFGQFVPAPISDGLVPFCHLLDAVHVAVKKRLVDGGQKIAIRGIGHQSPRRTLLARSSRRDAVVSRDRSRVSNSRQQERDCSAFSFRASSRFSSPAASICLIS